MSKIKDIEENIAQLKKQLAELVKKFKLVKKEISSIVSRAAVVQGEEKISDLKQKIKFL